MEGLAGLFYVVGLVVSILAIFVFFQMAGDVRAIRNELVNQTRYLEAISVNVARLKAKIIH